MTTDVDRMCDVFWRPDICGGDWGPGAMEPMAERATVCCHGNDGYNFIHFRPYVTECKVHPRCWARFGHKEITCFKKIYQRSMTAKILQPCSASRLKRSHPSSAALALPGWAKYSQVHPGQVNQLRDSHQPIKPWRNPTKAYEILASPYQ